MDLALVRPLFFFLFLFSVFFFSLSFSSETSPETVRKFANRDWHEINGPCGISIMYVVIMAVIAQVAGNLFQSGGVLLLFSNIIGDSLAKLYFTSSSSMRATLKNKNEKKVEKEA